jgi:hypothetical protein
MKTIENNLIPLTKAVFYEMGRKGKKEIHLPANKIASAFVKTLQDESHKANIILPEITPNDYAKETEKSLVYCVDIGAVLHTSVEIKKGLIFKKRKITDECYSIANGNLLSDYSASLNPTTKGAVSFLTGIICTKLNNLENSYLSNQSSSQ